MADFPADNLVTAALFASTTGELVPVPAALRLYADSVAPVPAATPPAITNLTPAAGSTLTRSQPIGFDVTDADGLRRVLVLARYPSLGLVDVVHDGTAFAPLYAASTREAIAGGYRYSVTRVTGWPAAPTLTPYAVDVLGAETPD